MTTPNLSRTTPLQPEDCRTLGVLLGGHWYLDHRGAGADEQACACDVAADDLQIPDRANFVEGWSAAVRLLEQQAWHPCVLCGRQRPRAWLRRVGEDYFCLPCYHEQEEIEQRINEHEARHS